MIYFLAFLEGIITFVSPCMLPMLPLYLSYFAAGGASKKRTVINSLGFVLGFTLVFITLGAFAGQIGHFLIKYRKALDIITGIIVIAFGLSYLGILNLNKLFSGNKFHLSSERVKNLGFISSVLFGIVFSIGWTPCVGAFLGSALMMAASTGQRMGGIIMLLCYSAGLGIPFVLSAVMIDRLKISFTWIKNNYDIFNLICGSLLVILGILMMTGLIARISALLI